MDGNSEGCMVGEHLNSRTFISSFQKEKQLCHQPMQHMNLPWLSPLSFHLLCMTSSLALWVSIRHTEYFQVQVKDLDKSEVNSGFTLTWYAWWPQTNHQPLEASRLLFAKWASKCLLFRVIIRKIANSLGVHGTNSVVKYEKKMHKSWSVSV